MNAEILKLAEQLKDTYEGEPWYGKNAKTLFGEAETVNVFEKPNGQHSILELLWHMLTWREFTLSRLLPGAEEKTKSFEAADWRQLDANDKSLWDAGLKKFGLVHNQLVETLQQQQDSLLIEIVPGRQYSFRYLLYGIVQHDVYHLGQIAYCTKLLKG